MGITSLRIVQFLLTTIITGRMYTFIIYQKLNFDHVYRGVSFWQNGSQIAKLHLVNIFWYMCKIDIFLFELIVIPVRRYYTFMYVVVYMHIIVFDNFFFEYSSAQIQWYFEVHTNLINIHCIWPSIDGATFT